MYLYQNKELFEQLILKINADKGIESSIIEKDYYITLILQELVNSVPNLLFKGGTSLSKCYKLIQRFSEDIDLTLSSQKITQGERKKVSKEIIKACEGHKLEIINKDEIKSNMNFNNYKIEYCPLFQRNELKQYVLIDTVLSIKSFPSEIKSANSIIGEYLIEKGLNEVAEEYNINSFKINVQCIERTFIDKVFALCDYYLRNKISEHSRHIYDIYKIYPNITLDASFKNLIKETRDERSKSSFNESAKTEKKISEILNEIITAEVFKKDYNDITRKLLFEDVSYDKVIEVIEELRDNTFFD